MRPPLNSKRKLGVHKNEARRNVFRARHRVIRDFFGVSDEFNRPNSIRMARISRFTINNFAEGYVHDEEG